MTYEDRLRFTGKEFWPGKTGEGPIAQTMMDGMREKFAQDANVHLGNLSEVLQQVDSVLDTAENILIYFETQKQLGSDAEYANSKRQKISAAIQRLRLWRDKK